MVPFSLSFTFSNHLLHSLAYAELYLTIGGVFRRFDIDLFEMNSDDVKTELWGGGGGGGELSFVQ